MAFDVPTDLVELAARLGLLGADDPGPHAVVLIGEDRVLRAASPHAEALFGLSEGQLRGNDTRDPRWTTVDATGTLLRFEDRPNEVSRRTGSRVDVAEIGVHRPDVDPPGRHIWLRTRTAMSTDPAGVVTVALEVGPARAAELRLAESERLHRLIAETSRDVGALLGLDGRVQWVSPAAVTVLGRDPALLVGELLSSVVHPDDLDRLAAVLAGVDHGTTGPEPLTVRARRGDGTWVWLETTIAVLRNDAGIPVQLRTASRDVTARVAAEQARDAAEAERDRAVRLLESVLDHAPVGIAVRPVEGEIVRANRALAEMMRLPADALVGSRLTSAVDPADAALVEEGVAAMRRGERDSHTVDVRVRRGDGTTMWARRTAVLLRDDAGDVEHLLVQVEDVTEARLAAAELQRAASTDPLTGLLHRGSLPDTLEHAMATARERGRPAGVLYVDLDDFKAVNDTLGHPTGDEVLRTVARRLREAVRPEDVVHRVGGDEFVVVCAPTTGSGGLDSLAARLRECLAQPITLDDGTELAVGATVGLATAVAGDGEDLLHRADQEMYARKTTGTGRSAAPGPAAGAHWPG